MFGMGMGELLLIMVVALLVVGPDKLPQAAKAIGKGIRDFRRHTLDLQSTLEQDENLGEAVRELRSALRDDPFRPRPSPRSPGSTPGTDPASTAGSSPGAESTAAAESAAAPAIVPAAGAVAKEPAVPSPAPPSPTGADAAAVAASEPARAADPRTGMGPGSKADDPAHG